MGFLLLSHPSGISPPPSPSVAVKVGVRLASLGNIQENLPGSSLGYGVGSVSGECRVLLPGRVVSEQTLPMVTQPPPAGHMGKGCSLMGMFPALVAVAVRGFGVVEISTFAF